LINDGAGKFRNVLSAIFPDLSRVGMVSDAEWLDLDGNGYEDLVLAGDFMPIRVFMNQAGSGLEEVTGEYFNTPLTGRWSVIKSADIDQDGDEDLIAGNFGRNSLLTATEDKPLGLYYLDFDISGTIDPVFTYYEAGEEYPYASRYEMFQEIKTLEARFPTHESYSEATIQDIFPETLLELAGYAEVTTLSSFYLENRQGRLIPHELPVQAQFAPVYAIEVSDFNKDGYPDLVLAGNQSATRVRLGPVDANFGQLYTGDGKGFFRYIEQSVSGFKTRGDTRSVVRMNRQGKEILIFGVNNSPPEFYVLENQ
jgi:hypothetical protein